MMENVKDFLLPFIAGNCYCENKILCYVHKNILGGKKKYFKTGAGLQ